MRPSFYLGDEAFAREQARFGSGVAVVPNNVAKRPVSAVIGRHQHCARNPMNPRDISVAWLPSNRFVQRERQPILRLPPASPSHCF